MHDYAYYDKSGQILELIFVSMQEMICPGTFRPTPHTREKIKLQKSLKSHHHQKCIFIHYLVSLCTFIWYLLDHIGMKLSGLIYIFIFFFFFYSIILNIWSLALTLSNISLNDRPTDWGRKPDPDDLINRLSPKRSDSWRETFSGSADWRQVGILGVNLPQLLTNSHLGEN